MTDLGLASTALNLVNGTISLLKQVNESAKISDDIDLKIGLSEITSQVVDLKVQIIDLTQENSELRKQLEEKVSMRWDSNSGLYYQEGDETPFCPACLDRDKKLSHLRPTPNPGWGHICNVCKGAFQKLH